MGYRGKLAEQARARELRAQSWRIADIATELGVAKSSVSLWVRDVAFEPRPRRRSAARKRKPNVLARRKQEEIDRLLAEGRQRIGTLSEREFLVAGVALYAGEGAKTDGAASLANTNPRFLAFFCAWLRQFFPVEESRLRARLYLHEGLDLEAAVDLWSKVTGIPPDQFLKPYRATPDGGRRAAKHVHGCCTVTYNCVHTHRRIMGLIEGLFLKPGADGTDDRVASEHTVGYRVTARSPLLYSLAQSGVAQSEERRPVKAKVVGSRPTPGATKRRVPERGAPLWCGAAPAGCPSRRVSA